MISFQILINLKSERRIFERLLTLLLLKVLILIKIKNKENYIVKEKLK